MMKSELLEKLYLLELDTSALSEDAKKGYVFAIKKVIDCVDEFPMEKDEASKILLDWIDFVHDPNASPNETPYPTDVILEAMRLGAEALKK